MSLNLFILEDNLHVEYTKFMFSHSVRYVMQCSFSVFWEWGRGPLNWENQHVKYGNWEKLKCVYSKSGFQSPQRHSMVLCVLLI